MIELSTYRFELLRNDKELNLHRGRGEGEESDILVLSPAVEYPAPEILCRLKSVRGAFRLLSLLL